MFLKRAIELRSGKTSICKPTTDPRVFPYYPFMSSDYPYRKEIGDLNGDPWRTILNQPPESLIPDNPFEASKFRKNGLQIWDAAIGIKACQYRTSDLVLMSKLPAKRMWNRYWYDVLVPALNNVGPLGPNKSIVRPVNPFIWDLTADPNGWRYLEAAHVLAHYRGDHKLPTNIHALSASSTAGHRCGVLGEMWLAKLTGMPLYVGPRNERTPAMPDFAQYGVEVKTSTRVQAPLIRAPASNREALRFDQTIAVAAMATFIEPLPYGYLSGDGKTSEYDKWSCGPSMVVFAGWEMVDAITHQPLVTSNIENPSKVPICYGMHPGDMLGPDTFAEYIRLAKEARGEYKPDNRYVWNLDEWLDSTMYQQLKNQTPPMPCDCCLMMNPGTEGAPVRPAGRRPEELDLKTFIGKKWKQWDDSIEQIKTLILDATMKHEIAHVYPSVRAMKAARRTGMQGWKRRMLRVKDYLKVKELEAQRRIGKDLTLKQEAWYKAHRNLEI